MLNEKGTVAALKDAYKSGYIVAFTEDLVLIRAGLWAVEIDESQIPPKVMGTLVEHIGVLPAAPAAYLCKKGGDPGTTCSLDVELTGWDGIRAKAKEANTPIRRTGLMMDGKEIWQSAGLKTLPVDPAYTRIIDEGWCKYAKVLEDEQELGSFIVIPGFAGTAIIQGKPREEHGNLDRLDGWPWLGEGQNEGDSV
jgi:hypothetical protein